MEFGMFVKERGFHSRHTILYDAKSWSDHKRHQLANRLFRQELAEKKLQQESGIGEYFDSVRNWNDEPCSLASPPLPLKPVALMDSLKRYPILRSASASKIRNLWNDRSNMPNISSRATLSDLAEAYLDSVRKNV